MPAQQWVPTAALLIVVALPSHGAAQDLEAVIEWNRILQVTVASTPTPTVFFTRPFAMTGIAVFDALNSIDHLYRPYVIEVTAGPNASREAAVAQAAHDVLVALYPGQRTTLDTALAATLNRLPAAAAAEGSRVGATTARAVLDARATDGWDRVPSPYLLPTLPGYYQVTPPQNAVVTFTHYPDVQPFLVSDRLQFLVAPPPVLTSERYAVDFNEVKAIGGATSTVRTEEQTSIARRWAGIGTSTPFQSVWNNLLGDAARRQNLTALHAARGFALMSMAMHDGLLVSFNGKFLYGLWRPVTAIREADRDGNVATGADPSWSTLIPTPPYPSYPGNQTCNAAIGSRTLERLLGRDDMRFSVTWTGAAGAADITRFYNGFRELGNEQARSRVYGGIHFDFDQTASWGVCVPLADYAFDNFLRAR
jgi:PAP2 superfamily